MPRWSLSSVQIICAALSFLIFCISVLSMRQGYQDVAGSDYSVERTAIAVAISNIAYGLPFGSRSSNVAAQLTDFKTSLMSSIEAAAKGRLEVGNILDSNIDGTGIGTMLVVDIAMRLFGIEPMSIQIAFLILMACTIFLFLLRFLNGWSYVVVLVIVVLTVMLFSPLATTPTIAAEIPIGGYRYFSLLSIIPGLHIALEFLDRSVAFSKRPVRWVALFGQAAFIVFVGLTNVAAWYMVEVLLLVGAYSVFSPHRERRERIVSWGKILLTVACVVVLLALTRLLTPTSYTETGRASDIFWHRVYIGLGLNPHWPFGNLSENYVGCEKQLPPAPPGVGPGLNPGVLDRNAQCVWMKYVQTHTVPSQDIVAGYGKLYESVVRDAFFNVVTNYPLDVAWTYLYYKPIAIAKTLLSILKISMGSKSVLQIGLLVAQLATLITVVIATAARDIGRKVVSFVALITFLGGLCSCTLYLAAWSFPWTSAELLFYVVAFSLNFCVIAATEVGRRLLRYREA